MILFGWQLEQVLRNLLEQSINNDQVDDDEVLGNK